MECFLKSFLKSLLKEPPYFRTSYVTKNITALQNSRCIFPLKNLPNHKKLFKQVLRIQKLNDREGSTISFENTDGHTGIQDYRTT